MRKRTVAAMIIFAVVSVIVLLKGNSVTRWIPIVLLAVGLVGGRWFCGHLCPVGWLQRLLHRLPLKNCTLPPPFDRALRWGKFAVLVAMPFMMSHRSATLALVLGGIAGVTILLSAIFTRAFCKYLCPVGALYGLFNHISLYQMRFAPDRCIHCHACNRACPMGVDPTTNLDSIECIRCGACRKRCPREAIGGERRLFIKNNVSL